MLKKYSNFCSVPWKQFATSTDGFQRMCCMMSPLPGSDHEGKRSITHGWFMYNNVNKIPVSAGLDAYINSDSSREIKKLLLDNHAPEQCRCYFNENIVEDNAESKRQYTLKNHGINTDEDVEKFISKQHKINYFDIRLGNVCNLQCLMCYGGLSNQLYDQSLFANDADEMELVDGFHIRKVDDKIVYDKAAEQKTFGWADAAFFKNLEKNVIESFERDPDQLIEFYFIGGEPLLNKPHFDFLNRMVELNYNKKIQLEYNTNLTVLDHDILDLWTKFEGITLAISIDDIGKRYEYIRYPGKWDKVESNLSDIKVFLDKHSDVFRTINIVSVINIFTADNHTNLVKVMKGYGFNVYKLISHDPRGTTPKVLTREQKDRFIDIIPHDEHFNELKKYILGFEYKPDEALHLKRMIQFWDSKRRTKFIDTYPELANIIF